MHSKCILVILLTGFLGLCGCTTNEPPPAEPGIKVDVQPGEIKVRINNQRIRKALSTISPGTLDGSFVQVVGEEYNYWLFLGEARTILEKHFNDTWNNIQKKKLTRDEMCDVFEKFVSENQ